MPFALSENYASDPPEWQAGSHQSRYSTLPNGWQTIGAHMQACLLATRRVNNKEERCESRIRMFTGYFQV